MLIRNKFLSDEEYKHLAEVLKRNRTDPHALIIEIGLVTGARACELLTITKKDLFEQNFSIQIIGRKGSRPREIPVTKEFFKALQLYSSQMKPDELLFKFKWTTVRKYWCKYRPARKGMHSLRHTFAVRLFKKTRDIRLVSMALGHKALQNTMIYAQFVYTDEELRGAITSLDEVKT